MNNTQAATIPVPPSGWLKSVPFDLTLIIGVAALAIGSGVLVVLVPNLFLAVLIIDLWFLGSPHVTATFSRLAFDMESFKQYKFLVIWLPLIVAVATITAAFVIGPWLIATTYLYWQWFHYTRQSYGIARIYQLKGDPQAKAVDKGVIYGLPLLGILHRSYQDPGFFLGLELRVIPVPQFVIIIGTFVLLGWMGLWAVTQYRKFKQGRLTLPYFMFMVSHIAVFLTGYIIIDHIDYGWLVINVWHNAQYILFVWMYHNKKFKNAYDPKRRFLSLISLNKSHWLFYATCLALSFAFYGGILKFLGLVTLASLPTISLIVYQTTNFHHYIVDGIIWRVRQKPVRSNLGIAG